MGYARLALYIVGLIVVVMAAWIFLTQTPIKNNVPAGVSLAIILLLVGIGVMAGARSMDDTFSYRKRVVRDADYTQGPMAPGTTYVAPQPGNRVQPGSSSNETVIEERRY